MRAQLIGCLLVMVMATAGHAQTARVVGETVDVVVERGDTLRVLGSRYGVDPATIAADNRINISKALAVGEHLRIDARHIVPPQAAATAIIVNVPQRMVFFNNGSTVTMFPVAVGRRTWPTPLGRFVILTREEHPTWDVPVSIQEEARRAGRALPQKVPPGPDNPLGDYWLGLSIGSVGIHGTNAPSSVYQAVTHGCIRMQSANIARLFAAVTAGTAGEIVYEPVLAARLGEEILLEVHPDVYRRAAPAMTTARARLMEIASPDEIDWRAVEAVVAARAGIARSVTRQVR